MADTARSDLAGRNTLVVFGGTGDLATRKLYPALASLACRDQLPPRLTVIAVARTELDDAGFEERVATAVEKAAVPDGVEALRRLDVQFVYVVGQADEAETYTALRARLEDDDGTAGPCLFYLATIPRLFGVIATHLGEVGLGDEADGGYRRLVVEKPFGHDLDSARELDATLHRYFREHQIFRIDHYLAKETVQNILALRFTNSIFEPLWNRRYVDHVQITVSEDQGVGHRGTFYEQAGALRDIVQNHVMQVLALTAMEPPASFAADPIRDEKVKLLRSIHPLDAAPLHHSVVRGQYVAGTHDGGPTIAYREEEGVDPRSTVETYLALKLDIDNWRWAGVPFYVRTGKRLARRVTEVALRYKPVPYLPLPETARDSVEPNEMIMRIQPDAGIELSFAAKVPAQTFQVRTVSMEFSYGETFDEEPPEAYERVLSDALVGDATLFIRSDEVEESWRIVQPLVDGFERASVPLAQYAGGSWGPEEAAELISDAGDTWREP